MLLAAAVMASPAEPLHGQPKLIDPCLFGVWEVAQWSDRDSNGNPMQPDRNGARGRFIYTPGGLMSVQVMLDPEIEHVKNREDTIGLAEVARNMIEYFGHYEADAETGSLTHRSRTILSAQAFPIVAGTRLNAAMWPKMANCRYSGLSRMADGSTGR